MALHVDAANYLSVSNSASQPERHTCLASVESVSLALQHEQTVTFLTEHLILCQYLL